jgi:Tol biopolymer transport system component
MIIMPLVLLLAAVSSANPAGQIAIVSGSEQEDQRVCVLDLATKVLSPIGRGVRDGAPVWSHDGTQIAFESQVEGDLSIFVVNADGTNLRQVSKPDSWCQMPNWSGDGKKIAYCAGDGFDTRIVVHDLESGIEEDWGGRKGLMHPVWWNDSTIIGLGIINALKQPALTLHLVTKKSASRIPENARTSDGDYVEWAPNLYAKGKSSDMRLAFESNDGGDREVFVLSLKIGAYDVSNDKAADWNPVWSPDGKWLAFESFRGGKRGIYKVFPETAHVSPIVSSKAHNVWSPTWSPDGEWIAYVSDQTGDPELFAAPVEGGTPVQLTDRVGPDFAPSWRPEPQK